MQPAFARNNTNGRTSVFGAPGSCSKRDGAAEYLRDVGAQRSYRGHSLPRVPGSRSCLQSTLARNAGNRYAFGRSQLFRYGWKCSRTTDVSNPDLRRSVGRDPPAHRIESLADARPDSSARFYDGRELARL